MAHLRNAARLLRALSRASRIDWLSQIPASDISAGWPVPVRRRNAAQGDAAAIDDLIALATDSGVRGWPLLAAAANRRAEFDRLMRLPQGVTSGQQDRLSTLPVHKGEWSMADWTDFNPIRFDAGPHPRPGVRPGDLLRAAASPKPVIAGLLPRSLVPGGVQNFDLPGLPEPSAAQAAMTASHVGSNLLTSMMADVNRADPFASVAWWALPPSAPPDAAGSAVPPPDDNPASPARGHRHRSRNAPSRQPGGADPLAASVGSAEPTPQQSFSSSGPVPVPVPVMVVNGRDLAEGVAQYLTEQFDRPGGGVSGPDARLSPWGLLA
jgi:hypothetical protein